MIEVRLADRGADESYLVGEFKPRDIAALQNVLRETEIKLSSGDYRISGYLYFGQDQGGGMVLYQEIEPI